MPDAPNAQQLQLWNQASGQVWLEFQPVLDAMLAPVADILVETAMAEGGSSVLDVGCGAGALTLQMAQRLGPYAHALGVDISAPLLAAARRRPHPPGSVAGFLEADAQTYPFETGAFDAVVSRFGVMFFDDPVAAFTNIRRACRPDASLTFMAWRSLRENPFYALAQDVAAPYVALPERAADAPGQFAFADSDRIRSILAASGWRSVQVRALDTPTEIPEAHLQAFLTRMGPLGHVFPSLDPATQRALTEALRLAAQPFVAGGAARFQSACWLVTAQA